jgi:glycosyltransferase involved in cell wall biosynthesis
MKILFVFNHPAPYKVRLFNEIAKEIDLHVIFERKSAKDRPNEFYNCQNINFRCTFLKKGGFSNENSFTFELKKYIKHHHKEYDLIIMNGYSTISEIIAIRYMKKHKIPFVLYINGGVIRKESKFKAKFKKNLILAANKYLSPSLEASKFLQHYSVNLDDIHHYSYSTIYNNDVTNEPIAEENKNEIRSKYNLPSGKIFVTASSFIPRKNIEQLINIFKEREETLLIIGDGPLKEKYIQLIQENNSKNIIMMSYMKKDELFNVLKCCDCFITLSKEDIYGHTINEAFANGLPVISSNKVVSSQTLIKNGENGYVVELDDEQIQNAINNINDNMSINAINTAKNNTIEISSDIHVKIFKELIR